MLVRASPPALIVTALLASGCAHMVAGAGSDGAAMPDGSTVSDSILSSDDRAVLDGSAGDVSALDASSDSTGTLTDGATADVPRRLHALHIFAGGAASCAVLSDYSLECWGWRMGQLSGSTGDAPFPVGIPMPNGIAVASGAVGGGTFLCALDALGSVYCLGSNAFGQLGTGDTSDRTQATRVQGLPPISQVVAGGSFTCALAQDTTVLCWGANEHGQLGASSTSQCIDPVSGNPVPCSTVPTRVSYVGGVTSIGAGSAHACVATRYGTVACWGDDSSFQIGTTGCGQCPGSSTSTCCTTPTAVAGVATATQLALGYEDSCALLHDGTVDCWGAGSGYALGNASQTSSATPVQPMMSSAEAIAFGAGFGCGLVAGGTVECWGTFATSPVTEAMVPTAIDGISSVTEIAGGTAHTCALEADGTVWCWGSNQWGALGDGTYFDRNTPAPVLLSGP